MSVEVLCPRCGEVFTPERDAHARPLTLEVEELREELDLSADQAQMVGVGASRIEALLREARTAGPPAAWPAGRQLRWAAEVDELLGK